MHRRTVFGDENVSGNELSQQTIAQLAKLERRQTETYHVPRRKRGEPQLNERLPLRALPRVELENIDPLRALRSEQDALLSGEGALGVRAYIDPRDRFYQAKPLHA